MSMKPLGWRVLAAAGPAAASSPIRSGAAPATSAPATPGASSGAGSTTSASGTSGAADSTPGPSTATGTAPAGSGSSATASGSGVTTSGCEADASARPPWSGADAAPPTSPDEVPGPRTAAVAACSGEIVGNARVASSGAAVSQMSEGGTGRPVGAAGVGSIGAVEPRTSSYSPASLPS